MEHLVDTNILLRSVDRIHTMHNEAVGALRKLIDSGEMACFTPQNIVEFWNVCTRPLNRNGLGLSSGEADAEVSRLDALLTLLPDHPAIYPEWKHLVITHAVSGAQVHDARLVAVMNVYKVRSILTFNVRDFARYPHIRCMQPRDLLAPSRG